MDWWLGSVHNTQKTSNPYSVVTVHGNKSPKRPWVLDPNTLWGFGTSKTDEAARELLARLGMPFARER